MTTRDLVNYRLVNQHIARSSCKTPGEVVAKLGAMQAQDYPGALWSIGLRLPVATLADVERAITGRTIVRTWPMRGTLHFVAAADVRWMLELLGPRIVASRAARHEEFGLGSAVLARCEKLATKALQGGKQLPRDELLALLEHAGISTASPRGYIILWTLAHHGVICFGAHQGKQPTFALLSEWAPQAKSLPRDQSLAELARRYFTSHGPATLHDFVWWSGLKVADARAGLEMVSSHLARATVEGKVYWMPPELQYVRDASPSAYLLPGFDEFLLGYTDRTAALDSRHASRVVPGNNGMFMSTIVINGRVMGLWNRALKKNSIIIIHAPFGRFKKVETQSLTIPAGRYGQFHGMTAALSKAG